MPSASRAIWADGSSHSLARLVEVLEARNMGMIDHESLTETLIVFLCEHSGLSRDEVVRVLDAQDRFWDTRLSIFNEVMEDDSD